jgi:hypothetical protein
MKPIKHCSKKRKGGWQVKRYNRGGELVQHVYRTITMKSLGLLMYANKKTENA